MSDIREKAIARDLLSIGAVFLRPEQPFTWASGIHSPIYCDNRLILSAPAVRDRVEAGIAELVRTYYPDCQMLMGYVRGENKSHGRTNRIEGRLEPGTKTVVVEDLISTAGSAVETVEALREAGAEVLGIVSIFTYGMQRGLDRLAAANTVNHSLSNLDALLEVAVEARYIAPEWQDRIRRFRDNPSDESWMKANN